LSETQQKVEAWANNGMVWIAGNSRDAVWYRIESRAEVDEFIAALEAAKEQAFPEQSNDRDAKSDVQ
jgi:hypothetical protein